MSQFSFEQKIEIVSKMALDYCNENGLKFKQYNQKFAELIIRECIGCCEQVISDPVPKSVNTWLNGGEQCIQEIKEHFGVEE